MKPDQMIQYIENQIPTEVEMLNDFCQTHLNLFKQKGLKSFNEDYKFTNLTAFFEQLEVTPYESSVINLESYINSHFINLIFIDGELKNIPEKMKGLKITKMEETLSSSLSNQTTANAVTHLHHGLMKNGFTIEVEKNTKIEKPIRIVNKVTHSGLSAGTLFIKLATNAQAFVFEENVDTSVSHAHLQETYVVVEAGAHLEHVQVSAFGASGVFHSSTNALVYRDGNYRNVLLNLSAKLNRRNLNLELLETGAHGESYNLYLANETEHSDIHTVIQHKAADTTSNQLAKGIMDGDSKGIFTGKIHIHPHAQRVVAGQLNKNLLLSKKAQAHSCPQLEIFADDVKCSHGSTTGQLSDDEVFYFEARGIPSEKAKTLLALGFALEVVLKIKHSFIQEKIKEYVLESLKTKFHLGSSK